ncbi:hypothetical protein CNR22_22925 [Sphingobacteriaceae bacterium]|nr:hypothetical protein CNR22_22925 [Sphingobacteriaceae bacterium]
MISPHDIKEVALLYEPGKPIKVLNEFLALEKKDEEMAMQTSCNLKLLMRVSQCILSCKDKDTRFMVHYFLGLLLDKNFDKSYSYQWQELKSVLWYCSFMKNTQSFKAFKTKLESTHFRTCISTCIKTDALSESRRRQLFGENAA